MTPTYSGTPIPSTAQYCTLAELRASPVLNWPSADTTQDAFFNAIIDGVSRSIDNECSRYFYKSASHEVRYFTAKDYKHILIGDYVSITALYTDTITGDRTYPYTWATTDYDAWPYDAATDAEPAPYRYIDATPRGLYQFPVAIAKGIKVDGIFGWPQVPSPISKACLLWSARVFKRYETPLGIASMSALGKIMVNVPPPDPDVSSLMMNYRLVAV